MFEEMRNKYREIRKDVFEKSTAPLIVNTNKHEENKDKFKKAVISICDGANLSLYKSNSPEVRRQLWNHLWVHNRYAGIRSQIATTEVGQIKELFDKYEWFSDSGWDFKSKGYTLISANHLAQSFLNRSGDFTGKQTIGNLPKLHKIVSVARAFSCYFDKNSDGNAIDFVTRNVAIDNVWAIHDQLINVGYKGDLTVLHFMMDVGFQVIKPDVVISRLFLDWGWLHHAIPSLPSDVSRDDLLGAGKYKSKYHYTKPTIYKPIIDITKKMLIGIDADELKQDIGWVTNNPIREFDIFIVKAGQMPEREFGVERRLYD